MPDLPDQALEALVGAAIRGRARQVEAILGMHPGAAARSVHAAAVLLDAEGLALVLESEPGLATAPGPGGANPLQLTCASRLDDDDRAARTAQLLLAYGADADDGRAPFAALAAERRALLDVLLDAGCDPASSDNPRGQSLLHFAADECWVPGMVRHLLERGADPDARWGPFGETVLHTAVRRRRLDAVDLLLDHGAAIDARTTGGDTAWRHALRRPFPEVAARLAERGADTTSTPADELAQALTGDDLDRAAAVVDAHPEVVPALAPEEARLLGDLSGQGRLDAVRFLLDRGADIEARGLDGGTPLQQCCWFAQPAVARELAARGADVHAKGCDHDSTPMGWVTHGSRYSGGAEGAQERYLELLDLLLDAGARVDLPGDPPDRPGLRLWRDATDALRERLLERVFTEGPPA